MWVSFAVGGGWSDKRMLKQTFYTDADIWLYASRLFEHRPKHMRIRTMGMYLYQITPSGRSQLSMLDDVAKAGNLTTAIDEINSFYGNFTVFTADTLTGTKTVKQKIPFGGTDYFEALLKRA